MREVLMDFITNLIREERATQYGIQRLLNLDESHKEEEE